MGSPAQSSEPVSSGSATATRRRVDRSTLAVVAALVVVAGAWVGWARLTAAPGGSLGWTALDSIRAATADRHTARPAPAFTLPDATGQPVSLEDLRGEVVLVNFWATWCVPCRAEMPELDQAARDYGPAGFRVLAVNILEDADSIRRYGAELGLQMPLLVDHSGEVYKAYSVQGLPASFLVDRDGVVRDVRLGVITRGYLDSRLPSLLATR